MSDNNASPKDRLRGQMAVLALRLLALLPLALNRRLGALIGWFAWLRGGESRRVSQINVDICFADLQPAERATLVRQSMIETGKGAIELAYLWLHPQRALPLIRRIDGDQPLRDTLASGRPVIVLAPHLGCWEMVNFWLSSEFDLHAMFKPSKFEQVNALVGKSRSHFKSTLHPATARGVAGVARALKSGPVVTGILPDQVPDKRSGDIAPFFGRPTFTGTLTCKLLQQSGARAFMMFAKRLPGTEGYELIIREPDPAIYDAELDSSLAAMNRSIEALIREAPEQYIWNYKRFRRKKI
ncbi:lysophospholipid acyltransferase family protein, partial [Alcanivorax sp. 1008]|uniref:lysophospholipid acyltransferase family protein n=1 Tax=Alcanivorax sp. 1008 TaxID=2816853 RepID=UPI001E0D630D